MYHNNIKLDFISPFGSNRSSKPIKTTNQFFMNYYNNFNDNPGLKRDLGLSLLFESKKLIDIIPKKISPVSTNNKLKTLYSKTTQNDFPFIKENLQIKKNNYSYVDSLKTIHFPLRKRSSIGNQFKKQAEMLLTAKKTYNFEQDKNFYIKKNVKELKNLSKKVKEKRIKRELNPYYTISVMNKIYNEYFFNNLEIGDILKEDKNNINLEQLKYKRTKSQIERVFKIKGLADKERKLLYNQMLFEFDPEKLYYNYEYSKEIYNFLILNENRFCKNDRVKI